MDIGCGLLHVRLMSAFARTIAHATVGEMAEVFDVEMRS